MEYGKERSLFFYENRGLHRITIGLQEETLTVAKETSTDVKGIRKDLNKTLTCEIAGIREELREIRSALIQAGILNIAHS